MLTRKLAVDNKTFIAAIRANNLPAVRVHAESGCFGEQALQNAMTLSAFCGHRRLLRYFFNKREHGEFAFLDTGISLEAASAAGKVQGVVDLVTFGADLHCDEDFPYYLALCHNHPVTAFYLHFSGIDINSNEHALRMAFKRGWRDLVYDIFGIHAHATNPSQGLEWSVRSGKVRIALGAMLAGADPARDDSELLFRAIESGQDEMIRVLVENGADVLARGERILLDSARKSQRGSTIQTVFRYVQKARSEPAFIPAGTGRPQGMKTISGPAEFTRPPQIVPTLRPHGMGWRSSTCSSH